METTALRELSEHEVELVSGGALDFSSAGIAIIGLGFVGGPATGLFGLAVGGSLLYLDNC
jgi:hypothetical protein